MHDGQPEEWKKRWQDLGMPGGMPDRDFLIQEFGSEVSVEQLKEWAKQMKEAKINNSPWDVVSAKVYKLTDSFGDY